MFIVFFFFKQKTSYEMRISDWSSDVCSSDLLGPAVDQRIIEIHPGIVERGRARLDRNRLIGAVQRDRAKGGRLHLACLRQRHALCEQRSPARKEDQQQDEEEIGRANV